MSDERARKKSKKKKEHRKEKDDLTPEKESKDSHEETRRKEKKKKKKKDKQDADDGEIKEQKAKRKSEVEDSGDLDLEKAFQKKKKKKHSHNEKDEEVQIGTNEEKISKEKGDDPSNKEEQSSATIGQWGKASFESTSQRDKFIRLLGGFKKGNTDSNFKPAGKPKFSSAAMDKTEEEKLNQKLETQYQQAFDTTRKRRGLGLGYEPAQDKDIKSFYIDKTASGSVKFD